MSEPSMEEKAIIIMTREALEIAIRSCTFRWLFCWDGETADVNDCACCIGWDDDMKHTCGCICHKRIRELDALFYTALRSIRMHNKSWFWDCGIDGKKRMS